jgi:hypothetical protein
MKKYEEMTEEVFQRMDAYEAERRRKKRMALRAAAVVSPLCLALLIGAGVWKGGLGDGRSDKFSAKDSGNAVVTEENTSKEEIVTVEQESVNTAQTTADKVTATQQTATQAEQSPAETTAPAEVPTQAVTQEVQVNGIDQPVTTGVNIEEGNGAFVGIQEGGEPTEFIKFITSYPGGGENSYQAPAKGDFGLSLPLSAAIDEYHDDAKYIVVVHIFDWSDPSNPVNVSENEKVVRKEFDRLAALGYTSVLEGPDLTHYNRLCLHATEEELKNFAADPNYSYMLWLYDEIVPNANPTTPEVVNGVYYGIHDYPDITIE